MVKLNWERAKHSPDYKETNKMLAGVLEEVGIFPELTHSLGKYTQKLNDIAKKSRVTIYVLTVLAMMLGFGVLPTTLVTLFMALGFAGLVICSIIFIIPKHPGYYAKFVPEDKFTLYTATVSSLRKSDKTYYTHLDREVELVGISGFEYNNIAKDMGVYLLITPTFKLLIPKMEI